VSAPETIAGPMHPAPFSARISRPILDSGDMGFAMW
jgi:hypothetical protein